MVAFAQRADGLIEATLDDGSKVAMLPSVVQSSGLYNQVVDPTTGQQVAGGMPEPPRAPEQLAQRDVIQQAGGARSGSGGPGRNVLQQQAAPTQVADVQPSQPTFDASKGATPIPRVAIPAKGQIKGQSLNPLEGTITSQEHPKLTGAAFVQPAGGGAAKFGRVKAESEGVEPTEKAQIFEGERELEGARAGTNIQLQEQALRESEDKKELAQYINEVANQAENRAEENRLTREKAQGEYNNHVKALDEQLRQIRDEPSARDKVMEEKGWFGSILAGIGLAIGSGIQAVTGSNPVRDILNDQVRDVADKQEKKVKLYGESVNRLGELRQQFKDEELARQQLELEISEAQNARLAAFAASSDSAAVRELAQITIAQRQEEFVGRQQELRMKLANKVANTYGWRGGGAGGAPKLMVQIPGPNGKPIYVTPEQANQLMNVEEKAQSLSGNPPPTAASKRQEVMDVQNRHINNPFGNEHLFVKGNNDQIISKTKDVVVAYNRLQGNLNHIENLRKEIIREKAPDKKQALVGRMQAAQREAAGVVSNLRLIGGYGAPTGPDLEQLDKEIGEIGQNLKGPTIAGIELPGPKWLGMMSEQVQGNIDSVRRISNRNLKAWLNETTSRDPINIVPPNFPLEDVPPPEGGPPGEVHLMKKRKEAQ